CPKTTSARLPKSGASDPTGRQTATPPDRAEAGLPKGLNPTWPGLRPAAFRLTHAAYPRCEVSGRRTLRFPSVALPQSPASPRPASAARPRAPMEAGVHLVAALSSNLLAVSKVPEMDGSCHG